MPLVASRSVASASKRSAHHANVEVFNNQVAIPPLAILPSNVLPWLEAGCSKRGSAKQAGPHVFPANGGVTDGDRTRDLRSHNSSEGGPVCPYVSVESAHLQVIREIRASDCPLRTGAYQPGCSTVAVSPLATQWCSLVLSLRMSCGLRTLYRVLASLSDTPSGTQRVRRVGSTPL